MSRNLLAFATVLALGAFGVNAQVSTGNIRGTVTDSTGGVLPNASVTVEHTTTGLQRKVTTNEQGDYNVPSVPAGTYQITVSNPGFQTKTLNGVTLQVDQTAVIPVTLETGTVSSTIEVTAAAPVLDSQTSSLGQVIENKRIVDLPLNGRNPFQLGALVGGAVPFQGLNTNLPILAGGGRHNSNDILLDGIDDNLRNYAGKVGRAGLSYTPSVDAVEEFKVKTNNFAAEYGHSAGYTMNATIKSGTNQFHGSLYDFLRNDKLDANSFVSNFSDKARSQYQQNQFGANIGGPVVLPHYNGHDKTFFFVDYEGMRLHRASGSSLLDMPSDAYRQGNFSGSSSIIYDPSTRMMGPNGVVVDSPFPNNTIPTAQLDPTALKFQSLIPEPNVGAASAVSRNLLVVSPQSQQRDQGDVKIDQHISAANSLMARVSISQQSIPSTGSFVFSPQISVFNTRNLVLSDTHVFSPNVVNEARVGYNRANTSANAPELQASNDFTSAAGLAFGPIFGFPSLYWNSAGTSQGGTTEFSNFGGAKTNFGFENTFQYSDSLSIIRGAHTFKMGADVRRFRYDRLLSVPAAGSYYFGPTYTANPSLAKQGGDPYADFLLGLPTSVTNQNSIDWSRQRDLYVGPYIQDDWKVSRRLTLNLGFRYDLYTQPVDAKDTGGMFDPNGKSSTGRLGIIELPGQNGFSRAITFGHHRNFAPRFGFAYQATPKFVVRGGWGIFYSNREQNDQTTDMAMSLLNFLNIDMPIINGATTVTPPYRFNSPLVVDNLLDPQFSAFDAAHPLSGDAGSSNEADIPFSPFPMLQQFNLALQYEFIPNLLVEVSYAGARGVHWQQRIDQNQVTFENALLGKNTQADRPFNFLSSSQSLDTADVSNWYNSANLRVERRFSHGLSLLMNYTISHATDSGNAGTSTYGNQANTRAMYSYNLSLERALSALDIPQKFVLSSDYELPIGRGKALNFHNSVLNTIIGNWQVNGILMLHSGFASDVNVKQLPPVFATINRPDRVLGQPLLVPNPSFDQYFNPAAFAVPGTQLNYKGVPIQMFGNSGKMVVRGPGQRNLDLSLFKEFRLSERRRIEFRAESFNLTNTPYFSLPSATSASLTVGNSGFGKLTSSQPVGRQVQFGLKFVY
ncbi:MAG TPA: TonB-dependent receptor [Bryobacteraceae bacterium]|nr:TonB-dependent receptor [Bryobacteraceae bacterium]